MSAKAEGHDKEHEHAKGESHGGGGGHGAHGGGGHEEHEGAPEWLISFADNVTLLMGFFVIMMAMFMQNAAASAGKAASEGSVPLEQSAAYLDAIIGIREAFNNPVDTFSVLPQEQPLVRRLIERKLREQSPDDGPQGKSDQQQSLRPTNFANTNGRIQFADNATEVDETGKKTIVDVARHLTGLQLVVAIRGHASAAEAEKSDDRGMKLAFERALSVAKELEKGGVEWRRMRIVSCGAADPVSGPVYDWQGHTQNQRVEIVLSNETSDPKKPQVEPVSKEPRP